MTLGCCGGALAPAHRLKLALDFPNPGSGLTREELHRLLSCLPSFEEDGEGGGGCDSGGDGGGDGGFRSGGDGTAQEHAQASRMHNAAHRES